jgi:SAM-dependent methyltransferase
VDSPTAIDDLIKRLRDRVEERKGRGMYPAELEADLDAHFERIAAHRPSPYDYDHLRQRLSELDEAMGFSPAHIVYESGLPGGTALHRSIGKMVSRQTAGVLEQMHRYADAMREVLREVVVVLEHPNSHVHAELLGQLDGLLERLADFERLPADSIVGLADLRRRLERLEAAEAARRFEPWYPNERFEDEFRGSRAELLERYDDLAARFDGCDPVVDLGCGRGEFLELLGRRGIGATGVELDPELVKAGVARGLEVTHGDAVNWLAAAPSGSLGGIALVQVIEHLTAGDRADIVRLAAEKLRPGGKILIETVNPQSLYVFSHAFYADPTHDKPVHPAYLDFLLKEAGFGQIAIEWRSLPSPDESLEPIDTNAERVNRILFGPQDYAIIATR